MSQDTSTSLADAPPARHPHFVRVSRKTHSQPELAKPSTIAAIPAWKRTMDVVGALTLLVALSPVFALCALFIRLASSGPIFFRQQRAGLLGRPFIIWKFRTLKTTTDSRVHQDYVGQLMNSDVPASKLDDRKHTIPFGRFLRATCLDELPQLLNVVRGDMSLVGPRPDVIDFEDYDTWQQRRFNVPPGMTGLWQVSGKNRTTFTEMIELDIRYVEQLSFRLDVHILLMTIPTIIRECIQERALPSADH